eukprot:CAMPEP_0114493454 /NCGR_PEP_ID=MMETSP0109-20121206/4118_1 /TAXON_ID=29199 /ORGANISM="Chlorarachnion reptans, Strain CCCM449" /LENGTH=136 /DNA_ID=CAMNT_0001670407 /DNA_START=250 /DNA_END=657 /DNA_ORIENTATION=+
MASPTSAGTCGDTPLLRTDETAVDDEEDGQKSSGLVYAAPMNTTRSQRTISADELGVPLFLLLRYFRAPEGIVAGNAKEETKGLGTGDWWRGGGGVRKEKAKRQKEEEGRGRREEGGGKREEEEQEELEEQEEQEE